MHEDDPKITTTVEVVLTPDVLAKAFWEMDANHQAEFFVALGHEAADPGWAFSMRVQYLANALRAHPDKVGIATFGKFAEYGYKFGALNEPAQSWQVD